MTAFSAPASTQGIDLKTANGHLLLISPIEAVTGVTTVHGPSDAIRADVVDLDSGEEFTDILIFPKVLQGQLRSKVGEKVLGRLGQGVAKPGQSAPWTLNAFSPDDAKKAQAWIDGQKPAFTAADSGAAKPNGWNDDAPF